MTFKADGFINEINITVDPYEIMKYTRHPLIDDTSITAVGFYPTARNHFRERLLTLNEYILIYCISGHGHVVLNQTESITLLAGHAFLIPPHTIHKYFSSEEAPWSILWVHFTLNHQDAQKFSLSFRSKRSVPIQSSSKINFVQRHFNDIIEYARMDAELGPFVGMAQSLKLLLSDVFLIEDHYDKETRLFKKAHQYMMEHLNTTISLNDLATSLQISEVYVNKIFNHHANTSPIRYFITLKMDYAQQLLSMTAVSIKEVAHQLGYSDPYYFSRIFKKETDWSPSQYRKMTRESFSAKIMDSY